MEDNVVWKSIGSMDYEISDRGEVRVKGASSFLKQYDRAGFKYVILNKKAYFVHRILMISFGNIPKDDEVIIHSNGFKKDNRLSNLAIVKQSVNIKNKNQRRIIQKTTWGKVVKIWERDVLKGYTTLNRVQECCRGDRDTYRGYKWEYEERGN